MLTRIGSHLTIKDMYAIPHIYTNPVMTLRSNLTCSDTGSESELKELPPTLTGITRTNPTFRPDDADTELTEEVSKLGGS